MKFYFCETCGKRITDRELEEGLARDKQVKGMYCRGCAESVMTIEFDAISLASLAQRQEPARKEGAAQQQPKETAAQVASPPKTMNVAPSRAAEREKQRDGRNTRRNTATIGIVAASMLFIIVVWFLIVFQSRTHTTTARSKAPTVLPPTDPAPTLVEKAPPATLPEPTRPIVASAAEPSRPISPMGPTGPDAEPSASPEKPQSAVSDGDAAPKRDAVGPVVDPIVRPPLSPLVDDQDSPRRAPVTATAEIQKKTEPAVDTPRNATPPAPRPALGKDLLSLIDSVKNAISGTWAMHDGALTFNTADALLEIPFEPPEEYDLEIVLARMERGSGTHIIFPYFGGKQTVFTFGGHIGLSGPGKGHVFIIKDNQKYTILLKIRKKDIQAFVDGKPAADRVTAQAVAVPSEWNLKDPRHLGLVGHGKGLQLAPQFNYYSIRVTPSWE
jgi:hypothetical protein